MAAGRLSPVGTDYGPCEGECEHRDCAQTRRMALSLCRICGSQIGYDRDFFVETTDPHRGPTVLVHALCAYAEADA